MRTAFGEGKGSLLLYLGGESFLLKGEIGVGNHDGVMMIKGRRIT